MSKRLSDRYRALGVRESSQLDTGLRSVLEGRLLEVEGCLLLEPAPSREIRRAVPDATGLEALHNKLHVEDYVSAHLACDAGHVLSQGLLGARLLCRRLEAHGVYRVLLGFDDASGVPAVCLRFFRRRPSEPWGPIDVHTTDEAVAVFDTHA